MIDPRQRGRVCGPIVSRSRIRAARPAQEFVPRQTAFTLIELLVTVALILVMYVMLYGPWTKNYQDKQKRLCQKQLQLLHVALQIYAEENHGWYPWVAGADTSDQPLSLLVPRCTAQTDLFVCPGTTDPEPPAAQPIAGRAISYAYYLGRQRDGPAADVLLSDEQVDTQAKIARQLVFSPDGRPPGCNHRQFGGNLLRRDGSVENSPPLAGRDLPLAGGVRLLNPKR